MHRSREHLHFFPAPTPQLEPIRVAHFACRMLDGPSYHAQSLVLLTVKNLQHMTGFPETGTSLPTSFTFSAFEVNPIVVFKIGLGFIIPYNNSWTLLIRPPNAEWIHNFQKDRCTHKSFLLVPQLGWWKKKYPAS